jgi:hypothetical protein
MSCTYHIMWTIGSAWLVSNENSCRCALFHRLFWILHDHCNNGKSQNVSAEKPEIQFMKFVIKSTWFIYFLVKLIIIAFMKGTKQNLFTTLATCFNRINHLPRASTQQGSPKSQVTQTSANLNESNRTNTINAGWIKGCTCLTQP